MAAPTESHSVNLSSSSAGKDEEPGKVIPRASAALAIVFAVYIYTCNLLVFGMPNGWKQRTPPQPPGPGHACRIVSYRSFSAAGV